MLWRCRAAPAPAIPARCGRAARLRHGGARLHEAAAAVIAALDPSDGSGGLVAAGMYRGYLKADGIVYTAICDAPYRSA